MSDSIHDLSEKVDKAQTSVVAGRQRRDDLETIKINLEEKHDALAKWL